LNKRQFISIYTQRYTPRFHYAKYLVFELLLGLRVEEYNNLESFEAINTPKINYSTLKIANSFQIDPVQLLFDDTIKNFNLEIIAIKGQESQLFPTKGGDINFDPLAAAFYVVSRYEEYLPNNRDEHDRYPAEQSILYKMDCLQIPIVQEWVNQLKEKLQVKFTTLSFSKPTFNYTPSFDIDMVWSYKGKGVYRTIGGYIKDFLSLDLESAKQRVKVNLSQQEDPFDRFEYFGEQTTKNNLDPIFFFLMGKYSDYDKNISSDHPKFKQLIKSIADQYKTGIHPSYYYEKNVTKEINYLEMASGKSIERSRQHFIKLKFPDTYQLLIENKIKADFSMGYPDKVGFRNGLAVPALWYDLSKEEISDFMVHPFQIMDVTLKNYLKLEPEQAIETIKNLTDTIYQYGGTMISIWHNSSFDKGWIGWQKVFEEMLSYAGKKTSNID